MSWFTKKDPNAIPPPTYKELEKELKDLNKQLEDEQEECQLCHEENANLIRRLNIQEDTISTLKSNLDTYRSLTEKYEKEIQTLGDLGSTPDRQSFDDSLEELRDNLNSRLLACEDGLEDICIRINIATSAGLERWQKNENRIDEAETEIADIAADKDITFERIRTLEGANKSYAAWWADEVDPIYQDISEIKSNRRIDWDSLNRRLLKIENENSIHVSNGSGGYFTGPTTLQQAA